MKCKFSLAIVFILLQVHIPTVHAGGAVVTVEALDSAANELDQDVGVIRFARSSASGTLVVNATTGGTAMESDIALSDGGTLVVFNTVTFGSGVSTRDITLPPNLDNFLEGQEQFDASLAAGNGYTIGTASSATVFIEDDPPVVTMEVIDGMASEAGQDTMTFRFARTGGNVAQALRVNVNVDDTSTADLLGGSVDLNGSDGGGVPVFGEFEFAAGQPSRDLIYTPFLDNLVEITWTPTLMWAGLRAHQVKMVVHQGKGTDINTEDLCHELEPLAYPFAPV